LAEVRRFSTIKASLLETDAFVVLQDSSIQNISWASSLTSSPSHHEAMTNEMVGLVSSSSAASHSWSIRKPPPDMFWNVCIKLLIRHPASRLLAALPYQPSPRHRNAISRASSNTDRAPGEVITEVFRLKALSTIRVSRPASSSLPAASEYPAASMAASRTPANLSS